MSDDEESEDLPQVTRTFHTGAAFERGEVHHRNTRGVERQEPSDGTQEEVVAGRGGTPAATIPQKRGIAEMLAGAPGRARAQPAARITIEEFTMMGPGRMKGKTFNIQTSPLDAAEDRRWVVIISKDQSNNRHYLCLRCGHEYRGKPSRVVGHCLRIQGQGVNLCTFSPTAEQREVLERLQASSSGTSAVKKAAREAAVAHTPSIVSGFGKQDQLIAHADEALAKFITVHDLSWKCFDSRNQHWQALIAAINRLGGTYKPTNAEVLSNHCAPVGETARPGGLYLALQSTQRERRSVIKAAEGTPSAGATLVSDGAKLSTRKRGMLNSSMVTSAGVMFLQSTDATGQTKNARYLETDYTSAIEKAGPIEVITRTTHSGEVVTKKRSKIIKIMITDRGGGCVNALKLMEEKWAILADTCKSHGADLLIEDLARPFKPHLKKVHEVIIFIVSHDALYGAFSNYTGVRALNIPAETRFATEVICVRSLVEDMMQIKHLFHVDPKFDEWYQGQDTSMRAKARKLKALVVSDEFWHVCSVFLALTEVVETSLRILDSDHPNLKDAAFAFNRIEKEIADPLVSNLAKIPDWGTIDLNLDLHAEHLGSLTSYAKAMVKKRKADWMSNPVIAAAAVNPPYSFSDDQTLNWQVPGADAAMRVCIQKLLWGDEHAQSDAIDGWDRFARQTDIYAPGNPICEMLKRKVDNPDGFWRHVHGSSVLNADKEFAQVALWLVNGYANQSASERTNKYLAEIHSKKRSRLKMEKGQAMLEVKMHEMFKKAQQRDSDREQRSSQLTIAQDLRCIYERARAKAKEKRELDQRLAAVQEEAEGEGDEEPLVTTEDALEMIGENEQPLIVPEGYQIVRMAPSTEALNPNNAASDALVNKAIFVRFENFGWCRGVILRKNTNKKKKVNGCAVNFIAQFDIDEMPCDLSLEAQYYDPAPDAPAESWLLLEAIVPLE